MPYPGREVPQKLPDSVLKAAIHRAPIVAELVTLPVLLSACETNTNQQLYILSFDAKNISDTPYAQLGQGASDFFSQHNRLQAGTSLTVLGISGETSFLVTPVTNQNGLKIATYEGTDGQIQNRALIAVSGTVPGTGAEYVAFYPLNNNAVAEKLFAGEPVKIYNTDLGIGFYALTLKPGLKMADFQREKDQATTPAQARQILEKYVDTFMIADPNDPQNKQFTVKVSGQNDLLDNLVGILTGVRPVSAAEITPVVSSPTLTTEVPSVTPAPSLEALFPNNSDFVNSLKLLNPNAISFFEKRGSQLLVSTADGTQHEVEAVGYVNTDIFGNKLTVEDAGYPTIDTLRGTGVDAGKVFAYNPNYGGWFEVIQSRHYIDKNLSHDEQMAQRREAINDPTEVTIAQVQNGDVAMSTILSGQLSPIPTDAKFTGTNLWHTNNSPDLGDLTLLLTSDKIPVDLWYRVKVNDTTWISFQPFAVWNPTDLNNPSHNQMVISLVGRGQERSTPPYNNLYLEAVYDKGWRPVLIVSASNSDGYINNKLNGSIGQPSIAALATLPGNDPAKIPVIASTIYGGRDMPLWQTASSFMAPDLSRAVEEIIWLSY